MLIFAKFDHMALRIHTDQLVKRYGIRTVVNHVSVEVSQGEIVGLLGPNGAGKTTSFYMVVGLVKPDEGNVYLDDQNITKLPMYRRAQHGIGYLPQEASVFRKLSIEDNIAAVLEMTKLTKAEQAAERAYRAGAISYLEWAQLQSEKTAARQQQLDVALDAQRALIEIQRLTGQPLLAPTAASSGVIP